MDSLTHIALGAIIGDTVAGKELGKKSLLLGAIAQSIPDIDFLASLWLSPDENLLAHRGFTHSLCFAILLTPLLALFGSHWNSALSMSKWIFFFGLQIFIHILLDTCNTYGVGWLEPFSHHRLSFNLLFVVDPFFSFPLGISALLVLFFRIRNPSRINWRQLGLFLSVLYILYAIGNKLKIESQINESLNLHHIANDQTLITPTPFNSWLWYAVIKSNGGYYISYRSVFDNGNEIEFTFFPGNDSLLNPFLKTKELQNLLTFSQGYYTINNRQGTLVFNVLRFGQISGWSNPKGDFAFHYYLNRPSENKFVVQRGRFAAWNYETIKRFWSRIKGK